jgi:Protein of unknown function (DUF3124)
MRSKDITRTDCVAGRIGAGYRVGLIVIGLLLSSAVPTLAQNREGPRLEQTFAAALTALPAEPLSTGGAVYVPAYSSVSIAQGNARADFSVTLSVHNASETKPLVIRRIAFFDGTGKMVQSYLKQPVALKPFATIEAFVPTLDTRGGTGANFVVDWAGSGEIAEPVVEALMLGTFANGHYAFISQGRPIRTAGR